MKFKEWRKLRPRCGAIGPPTKAWPQPWLSPDWVACRRLIGHKGRHQGGAYGRWSDADRSR